MLTSQVATSKIVEIEKLYGIKLPYAVPDMPVYKWIDSFLNALIDQKKGQDSGS